MRKLFVCFLWLLIPTSFLSAKSDGWNLKRSSSDLDFKDLPTSWDEGIPLGNATVGMLVWKNQHAVRFSLDRADLWDLRPTDSLSGPNFRFDWVTQHVKNKDDQPIHKKMDWPYDNNAAPSKIPGAALEFNVPGQVKNVHLYLNNAVCRVEWENGITLQTFVQASHPVGWFVFQHVASGFKPILIAPRYEQGSNEQTDPVAGQDLRRLGYKQGNIEASEHQIVYHQKGWGDFYYDVVVRWNQIGDTCFGVWCIESSLSKEKAEMVANSALKKGWQSEYNHHLSYWSNFWKQSSVQLPDPILQRQYDNEMYKLGSTSREHSYPISLQAVWTADNGKLPPWKGDYHHDLNTQLSYWPVYTGNHLSEGLGYLNTLWNQRDVYRKFTKAYFGKDGLDIPGVCTLTGEAMGGWIQYSLSQTTAAWLAQHFYLHWKYSGDNRFLKERAYPFIKEVATFLSQQLKEDADGHLRLEYSTSPEIFENSLRAWFTNMTNYDLSLNRFLFKAAIEMSKKLNLKEDSERWNTIYNKLPDFNVDSDGALTFAKGTPYTMSHRHFSHAMSIFPLSLINWEDGTKAQHTINCTLEKMEKVGPDWWTGYSYAWFACMKARAKDGDAAVRYLLDFANCFCLPNTFHVNGDQSGTGKSKFTYRPFTLEGNFAFAAGVQELLLQSYTGTIRVFPAIPRNWKNVSFNNLRAEGAFLVSASITDGKISHLKIYSERGNLLKLISPIDGKLIERNTHIGETIILK